MGLEVCSQISLEKAWVGWGKGVGVFQAERILCVCVLTLLQEEAAWSERRCGWMRGSGGGS